MNKKDVNDVFSSEEKSLLNLFKNTLNGIFCFTKIDIKLSTRKFKILTVNYY